MAVSDHTRGMLQGLALGIAAGFLARQFGKPIGDAARPLAKAGMQSLLEARERGEEWLAHAGESLSDIAAEVRAERDAARAEAIAAARTSYRPAQPDGET